MSSALLWHPNNRERLELGRDDDGKRVVKTVRGPRKSVHRGELIKDYDEDLQRPKDRNLAFRQMRNHGEVYAGLSRLKTPVEQSDDVVVPAEPLPKLPSVEAAEALLEEPPPEDLAQLDLDTQAAWFISSNLWGWPYPEYASRTPWDKLKREALNCVDFGAAFFERRYAWRDGPLGPRVCVDATWYMEPESISEIQIDREGELLRVVQLISFTYHDAEGKLQTTVANVDIPAEEMLAFIYQQEGADFGGRALLRILHGSWKRHGWMTRVRVIDCVRRGAPPPMIELDETWDDDRLDELENLAMRLATGDLSEQAWGVNTPGVKLSYLNVESQRPDLEHPISSEEETMRAVFGTESFTEGGGSLARAKEQTPYFNLTLLALSRLFIGVIHSQVIQPLIQLNWFGAGVPEHRQPGVVPRDMGMTQEMVKAKGVLLTGDVLQVIHEEMDLPPLSPELVADLNETPLNLRQTVKLGPGGQPVDEEGDEEDEGDEGDEEDEGGEDPQKEEKARPAATRAGIDAGEEDGVGGFLARKTWRETTERERRFLSLQGIEDDYGRHQRDWVAAVLPIRDALIEKAAKGLEVKGTEVRQPKPVRDTKALRLAMTALSEDMREKGHQRVAAEVQRQVDAWEAGDEIGMLSSPTEPLSRMQRLWRALVRSHGTRRLAGGIEVGIDTVSDQVGGELLSAIETDVAQVLAWVNNSVRDEMLEVLLDPNFTGSDDEAALEAAARAKEQGKPALDFMARDQASRSFNGGRAEEMSIVREDLPEGLALDFVVRVELLDDPATCDPCIEEDVDSHARPIPVDSPEFWTRKPPRKCKGRGRCRGFFDPVVMTLDQVAAWS